MNEKKQFRREGYLNEDYHYFHLRDTAGQERSYHFHEFDKLVLLLEGKVDYVVENVTYTLKPWTVLLVPHHAIHRALIDRSEPYERIILYLGSGFFSRTMPGTGLADCFETADRTRHYLLLPDGEQKKELDAVLRSFEQARDDARYGAQAMRDTMILQLLIAVNRIAAARTPELGDDPRFDDKIRAALSYINENLAGDLSIDTLSERVYLSRYHFMRLFKQQTGSTVHAYVRQKRLLCAARLIREGVPAQQAAADCGFNDYSVFHRAFRACFGVRPGDLKK